MARPRVRARLLAAAAELWRSQGMAALTTRAVAAAAGVTEASVFNNFGDKAGLLRALVQEALPEFARLDALLNSPTTPHAPWLEQVFCAGVDYFRAVLPLAAQAFGNPGQPDDSHSAVHTRLSQALATLQPPPADPAATALLLLGAAMHSATTQLAMGRSVLSEDPAELARRVVAGLFGQ